MNSSVQEKEPLRWLFLTSEAIDNFKQVRQITRYYELRWQVKAFHKAWESSGTSVDLWLPFVNEQHLQTDFQYGNLKNLKIKFLNYYH